MNKKSYITIGLGVLVIILGIGIYLVLTNVSAPTVQTIKNVLPFGTGEGVSILAGGDQTATGTSTVPGESAPQSKLFEISSAPVAGFVSFAKNGFTIVRFADRATGHIFDVDPTTLEKTQISNDTLPKVYEAVFNADGSRVVFRSLENDSDTIKSDLLTLIPPSASSTQDIYSISKTALQDNINELVGLKNAVFFTRSDSNSVYSAGFDNKAPKSLLSIPFTSWRLSPYGNSLLVYTKASSKELGYAYLVNGGSLTKVLGPLNGLVVLPSADGTNLLYSYLDSGNHLKVKNQKTGVSVEITPDTLAEKCVWSIKQTNLVYCAVPDSVSGNEPDSWYQGSTHFADQIWRFDANSPFTDLLADSKKDSSETIDAIDLALSPNEDYLFFINKNDLTLWALKLQ